MEPTGSQPMLFEIRNTYTVRLELDDKSPKIQAAFEKFKKGSVLSAEKEVTFENFLTTLAEFINVDPFAKIPYIGYVDVEGTVQNPTLGVKVLVNRHDNRKVKTVSEGWERALELAKNE